MVGWNPTLRLAANHFIQRVIDSYIEFFQKKFFIFLVRHGAPPSLVLFPGKPGMPLLHCSPVALSPTGIERDEPQKSGFGCLLEAIGNHTESHLVIRRKG
jgi:hypothetical protein